MNDVWNLNSVYQGFDDPAFEADFSAGKEKLALFTALTKNLSSAQPLNALHEGIKLQEEIHALASTNPWSIRTS